MKKKQIVPNSNTCDNYQQYTYKCIHNSFVANNYDEFKYIANYLDGLLDYINSYNLKFINDSENLIFYFLNKDDKYDSVKIYFDIENDKYIFRDIKENENMEEYIYRLINEDVIWK